MEGQEHSPEVARLRWLARGGLIWGLGILARLIWLQCIQHEPMARLAESQQVREYEILAPRGAIVDRTGAQLAVSHPAASLAINPRRLKDPTLAAEMLSRTQPEFEIIVTAPAVANAVRLR